MHVVRDFEVAQAGPAAAQTGSIWQAHFAAPSAPEQTWCEGQEAVDVCIKQPLTLVQVATAVEPRQAGPATWQTPPFMQAQLPVLAEHIAADGHCNGEPHTPFVQA